MMYRELLNMELNELPELDDIITIFDNTSPLELRRCLTTFTEDLEEELINSRKENGYSNGTDDRKLRTLINQILSDSFTVKYYGDIIKQLQFSELYKVGEYCIKSDDSSYLEAFDIYTETRAKIELDDNEFGEVYRIDTVATILLTNDWRGYCKPLLLRYKKNEKTSSTT